MRTPPSAAQPDLLLGIEGGATHTVALLTDRTLHSLARQELGPGNLRLLSHQALRQLLRSVRIDHPARLAGVGIGLAGARTAADRQRILRAAAETWPRVPCCAGNDLETALAAAEAPQQGPLRVSRSPGGNRTTPVRVLVLSGTGSCCFARSAEGKTTRVGGWGHLLGDRGSAYAIARAGLRAVLRAYDQTGCWPALGTELLRRIGALEPDQLMAWAADATKDQLAALAPEVFRAATQQDPLARRVIQDAAEGLAQDALACARRLAAPRQKVEFVLAGGSLLRQKGFSDRVRRLLHQTRPQARIFTLSRESVWGGVQMAAQAAGAAPPSEVPVPSGPLDRSVEPPSTLPHPISPTERRNPRSLGLDHLSVERAIDLFLSEDELIPGALRRERRSLARVCRLVARALRSGGRLFYVGAGTSGRLGVLDASECPPTFGTSPDLVQGLIAGGQAALVSAVEGAEDDYGAGQRAIEFRGVSAKDVVVGVAASGHTPFVWGALEAARRRRARSVLICFNPALKRTRRTERPDVVLAVDVGPELLTGSTRLKAGTATKLILNLISTLSMVRLGKVVSNLMVDLQPSNAKLRQRAIGLVRELTATPEPVARCALEQAQWRVREAVRRLRRRHATGGHRRRVVSPALRRVRSA